MKGNAQTTNVTNQLALAMYAEKHLFQTEEQMKRVMPIQAAVEAAASAMEQEAAAALPAN